jgi:hypothetical protein
MIHQSGAPGRAWDLKNKCGNHLLMMLFGIRRLDGIIPELSLE